MKTFELLINMRFCVLEAKFPPWRPLSVERDAFAFFVSFDPFDFASNGPSHASVAFLWSFFPSYQIVYHYLLLHCFDEPVHLMVHSKIQLQKNISLNVLYDESTATSLLVNYGKTSVLNSGHHLGFI